MGVALILGLQKSFSQQTKGKKKKKKSYDVSFKKY